MAISRKRVVLAIPSRIVAMGLDSLLGERGEFRVEGMFSDLSRSSLVGIRNLDADVLILDPVVLDFASRQDVRGIVDQYAQDAALIAFGSAQMDDALLKQYDESIGLYDDGKDIVRKLRSALTKRSKSAKQDDSELSQREKEILVSVAKGMQNKEIASQYNLSVYTVISHRKNITRKTGIKSVAGLTVYALLNNLIDPTTLD